MAADLPVMADKEAQNPDHLTDSVEASDKDTTTTPDEYGPAPDGGLRAWLVAAGSAAIWFSVLGYANSFGVFQQYYITHQLKDKSADDIAWIGSTASFLQFLGSAVSGPLFDRYGAWVSFNFQLGLSIWLYFQVRGLTLGKILRPFAVMYVFALMMVSLCHEYWQFMLAQGILVGAIQGSLQSPGMAAVSQFFDKKRGAALGATIAGSSIGGVVIPIALSKMLNSSSLGFGWSVRIIGFLITPFLLFACITVKARLPPRSTAFFIKAPLKDRRYMLLTVAFGFMIIGMFAPLFFYPLYAVSRGMSPTLASYMLAVINAASTFGRVIPGILADKIGRINIFAFGGIATGITILCMNLPKTNVGLVLYAVVFGFTSGTIMSGGATAVSVCCPDPRNMGTYIGMAMGMVSVAVLIGPPVNGALVSHYHSFLQLSIFSGVLTVAGGFVAIGAKLAGPEGLFAIV